MPSRPGTGARAEPGSTGRALFDGQARGGASDNGPRTCPTTCSLTSRSEESIGGGVDQGPVVSGLPVAGGQETSLKAEASQSLRGERWAGDAETPPLDPLAKAGAAFRQNRAGSRASVGQDEGGYHAQPETRLDGLGSVACGTVASPLSGTSGGCWPGKSGCPGPPSLALDLNARQFHVPGEPQTGGRPDDPITHVNLPPTEPVAGRGREGPAGAVPPLAHRQHAEHGVGPALVVVIGCSVGQAECDRAPGLIHPEPSHLCGAWVRPGPGWVPTPRCGPNPGSRGR